MKGKGSSKSAKTGKSKAKKVNENISYRSNIKASLKLVQSINLTRRHLNMLKKSPFFNMFNALNNNKNINHRKSDLVAADIIRCFDLKRDSFQFGEKLVQFTVNDVKLIYGIVSGGEEMNLDSRGSLISSGLAHRKFPGVETRVKITMVKSVIKEISESDDDIDVEDVVRLMTLHAMTSLFFTKTGDIVPSVFFHYVDNIDEMKNYNWANAIHSRLMPSVRLYHTNPKYVTGCVGALSYFFYEHTKSLPVRREIPRFMKWELPKKIFSFKKKTIDCLKKHNVYSEELELTDAEKKMFKNCEFVREEAEKEGEASGEQVNEVSGEKEVNLDKEITEGSESNEEESENENEEGQNENDGYKTPPDCEFENDFNFTAQIDCSLHEAELRDLKIEKQKLIADLEELEEKHNDLNDKYEELCASHLELSQVLRKKEEHFETNMNDASIRILSLEEDLKEMDLKKENEFELRLKEKELRMEEEFQRKLKESSTRIEALEKQIKENEDEKEKQLNVQNNDERLNMANAEIKKLKKLINENEVARIDEIKALNNMYAKDVEKYVVQIGKLTKEIAESEKEKEVMRSMIKTVKTRKRTKLEDDDFDYTTNARQIKKGVAAPTKKPKRRAAQTTKNEPATIDVENIKEKEPEPVKPLPPFNRKFSLTTENIKEEDVERYNVMLQLQTRKGNAWEKDNIFVSVEHLYEIAHDEASEDSVINGYLEILVEKYKAKFTNKPSNRTVGVITANASYYLRNNLTDYIKSNIDEPFMKFLRNKTRYILIPIHIQSGNRTAEHWTLLVFDTEDGEYRFYNSMRPRKKGIKDKYAPLAKEMYQHTKHFIPKPDSPMTQPEDNFILVEKCPQQSYGSVDCGIVVLMEIEEMLCRGEISESYDKDATHYFRAQMFSDFLHDFYTIRIGL